MSSAEKVVSINDTRALVRRYIARVVFSCLLGLGVVVYNFVADLLILSKSSTMAVEGVVGATALILTVNTVSIGVVTYTTRRNKNARPPLWVLPTSLALLAGLLLALLSGVGVTDLYPNEFIAFIAGAISGAAAGLAYALSIPGIRQDTIRQQIRRSLFIGGAIGILVGLYFFIKLMPPELSGIKLIQHVIAAFVSVPITIVGMLLSFVLGIELGDRYVER
jgi:hypothetical protein